MTGFTAPLKVLGPGDPTGNPQTEASGFVLATKQVAVGGALGQTRKIVTIPPQSTLLGLGFTLTSAFGGVDTAASAMVVSFGTSADPAGIGVFNVSAGVANRWAFPTSGAASFDTGGTVVLNLSALSTTTYTGGGRMFVEYVTVE